MMGSVAEWLTFGVLYLWVGLWIFDKINLVDKLLNRDDRLEHLLPLFTMISWPVLVIVAPFWRGR